MTQQIQTKQPPKGWKIVTLPEIVTSEKGSIKRGPFGGSLKKEIFVPKGYKIYEQQHAINNDFNLGRYFITKEKFEEMKAFAVKPRDFIISCSGTIGKIAEIPDDAEEGIINQALLKITLDNHKILNKYFKYLFKSEIIQKHLTKISRGVAIKNVPSVRELKEISFLLPKELEEQSLIVSEIEKQFSRLDESVKVLKSVKDKLQVYRKAVLKEAFEKINGRVSLYTIARIIDIDHKMPNKVENGIPFISPKDFFEPNGIDFDNAKNISNEDFLRLSKKCNPEEGDIIYSRIGTIGKVRLAPNKVFQISYSLCLIKLNEKKDRDYIFWVLQSPEIFSYAHKSKKSIGVPDLGLTEIRNFQIPYTNNLKLQQEIVQEIESKFSVIDKVEEVVNQSLIKSEKLRKSILKSAFEGKLVKFEEMK